MNIKRGPARPSLIDFLADWNQVFKGSTFEQKREPWRSKLISPHNLTTFQMESWYRSSLMALTIRTFENLFGFFQTNLDGRWSYIQQEDGEDGHNHTTNYILLLELESDRIHLTTFQKLASSLR